MDDSIKNKIDELVKNSDFIVSNPETIKNLKDQGLPIKSVFTTYEEYLDNLFAEKKIVSKNLIGKLPPLDKSIANANVESLYNEFQECFVLGIPGASITLAIILLEFSLKYRFHKEQTKDDPNSAWEHIEQLDFKKVVNELSKRRVITLEEKKKLDDFNTNIRNPYIHYNIQRLVKDVIIEKLPSINIQTGEVTIHRNLRPDKHPHLWFSAKKFLDKKTIISIVEFCINWVNKMLVE